MRVSKGDVVVVRFPYSDLSGDKRRPALVAAVLPGMDVILCQMTGRAATDADAIPVAVADFAAGGLRQPGVIRPNRLFTADRGIIAYKLGTLTPAKMSAVTDSIVAVLRRSGRGEPP